MTLTGSVTGNRYATYGVGQKLHERSVRESADFIESHLGTALLFPDRTELLSWAATQANSSALPEGWIALEFGVASGRTINQLADALAPRLVVGFDSFEGLPEDWVGWTPVAGSFSSKGQLPDVRVNVELVKGWIDQTLPPYLDAHAGMLGFVHVDTDLYGSCKTILECTKSRVASGTVIVFDELHLYPGWSQHELRALQETYADDEYSFIAFSNMNQAAIRIH